MRLPRCARDLSWGGTLARLVGHKRRDIDVDLVAEDLVEGILVKKH